MGATRNKAALLAVSVLFSLLASEIGLRVLASRGERRNFEEQLEARAATPAGARVKLGDTLRPSRNPLLVYELIPQLDAVFRKVPLTTNSHGFRDREYSLEKPAGVRRIVGLGDSVMFGWGVLAEDGYLARLEERLVESGKRWEILNTAVPGYNTVMQVALLEEKGLRFAPDLVIVGFIGNDLGLPNFVLDGPDPWDFERLFLVDLIRRGNESRRRLVRAPTGRTSKGGWRPPVDPERVPERYRYLVGIEAAQSALTTLDELSSKHGFVVLFAPMITDLELTPDPVLTARMIEYAKGLGFELFDAAAPLERYMAEHEIADFRSSELALGPRDPHPSALAHDLVARALHDHLASRGLVD